MGISLTQIIILALIQGAAELLPVSSSAHVIMAEKLMGIDPSLPTMTFLLVMLHTGTMFAVLLYFWPRWKNLDRQFLKMVLLATAVTGFVGLALKTLIEKVILVRVLGESHAEVEHLFKSLPLMSISLFTVGVIIIISDLKKKVGTNRELNPRSSALIGLVQALCLPFRGFSRSGATISSGLLLGIPQAMAENFSFALAVVLTPPVILQQLHRLYKAMQSSGATQLDFTHSIMTGMIGMCFAFISGLFALKWLSSWLEKGRWKYFGGYCMIASAIVMTAQFVLG